jgi:hypothetical protein
LRPDKDELKPHDFSFPRIIGGVKSRFHGVVLSCFRDRSLTGICLHISPRLLLSRCRPTRLKSEKLIRILR